MFSETDSIRKKLKEHLQGLTQGELSRQLGINRVSLAKYLATMVARGELECRSIGRAKLYTLSKRIPLENILGHTEDHVIVFDDSGKVIQIDMRTAALFNLFPEQMIGKSLGEGSSCRLFATDGSPLTARQISETRTEEILLYCCECILRLHKKTIPVVLSDGSRSNACILTDITEKKRMEDALRESETRYSEFFMISRDCVFITSPDGQWIDFNDATLELFGFESREELSKVPVPSFYANSNERSAFIRLIEQDGYVKEYPIQLKQKDGTIIDTLITSAPLRLTDGSLKAFIGSIRDITERKQAEAALKESEHRLMDIINFLPDATLVIDKNGGVLAWNRAMEDMTGIPAEQMIGKGNYEYALPFYHERRPITVDLVLHDDPAVVAKYPFMRKEGRFRHSEIFIPHLYNGRGAYILFTASPLYDAAGNITGAIESIRDITERRLAEEALQVSEEKYRTLFETMTQGVIYHDQNGSIIDANPAAMRILGLSIDQMLNHTSDNTRWITIHEDGSDFSSKTHPAMMALQTGKEVRDVIMGIRPPGKKGIVWIRVNAMPQYKPGEDTPYQVYTTFDDITMMHGPAGNPHKTDRKNRQKG